jgi:hypothetical protein
MASQAPILTIPIDDNEAFRVFSPAAYPFCIQQYRNYDTNMFSYSVNIGWPEGFPLLRLGLMEDQSHFIHAAHYSSGLFLGLVLLTLVVVLVGTLTLVERKIQIRRIQRLRSTLLLAVLQLILLLQIVSLYLLGNIIYPLGGVAVLIITLFPVLRFGVNRAIESNDVLEQN